MKFVLEVNKVDLVSEINFHLSQIPQSNLEFDVKGANIQIRQLKLNDLQLVDSQIDASQSATILVKKSTLLTDVNAEGEIKIDGYVSYSINSEWQMTSEFHYKEHIWLDNPDINIGLIQFSAKSIIDNVIEKQKSKLESVINDQLNSISDLSVYLKPLMPHVNQSFKLRTTQFHILPQIRKIIVESIKNTDNILSIYCSLISDTEFKLDDMTQEEASLPELLFLPSDT